MPKSRTNARACLIWMHGLGADASDMMGLAEQPPISRLSISHIFLNAAIRPVTINAGMSMPAWYDIKAMDLTAREDEVGLNQSEAEIKAAIDESIKAGFKSEQIFLAGFSQGGAMALYTGLREERPLAGIAALSAYMPRALEVEPKQGGQIPIFMANGRFDTVVLPIWAEKSVNWLNQKGYQHIRWEQYDMAHSVCYEEIQALAQWLEQSITEGV